MFALERTLQFFSPLPGNFQQVWQIGISNDLQIHGTDPSNPLRYVYLRKVDDHSEFSLRLSFPNPSMLNNT